VFFFDTNDYEKCKFLAGFTKIGRLIKEEEFIKMEKKIV
jgi:hypothetical protein